MSVARGGVEMDCKVEACPMCTQKCLLFHGKGENSTPLVSSFFKVMIGAQYSHVLFFPPQFTPVVAPLLHQDTFLEDSRGMKWRVRVSNLNDSFVLQQGWNAFVLDNGLQLGDFVVFNYIKGSHFFVQVFGQTACEKLNSSANKSVNECQNKRVRTEINFAAEDGPYHQNGNDSVNDMVQRDRVVAKNSPNGETRPEEPQAISAEKLVKIENQEEHQSAMLGLSNIERLKNNSSACGNKRTIIGSENRPRTADASFASQYDARLANKKLLDASDVEMIKSKEKKRLVNGDNRTKGTRAVSGAKKVKISFEGIQEESQNATIFSLSNMERPKNNSVSGGSLERLKTNSGTVGTCPADISFITQSKAGLSIRKPSGASDAERINSKERTILENVERTREPEAFSQEKLVKRNFEENKEESLGALFNLPKKGRMQNNSSAAETHSADMSIIPQHEAGLASKGPLTASDYGMINSRGRARLVNGESRTGGPQAISVAKLVKRDFEGKRVECSSAMFTSECLKNNSSTGGSMERMKNNSCNVLGKKVTDGKCRCPPPVFTFISRCEAGLPNRKNSGASDVEMINSRENETLANVESETGRAQAVSEAKFVKRDYEGKREEQEGAILGMSNKTENQKHPCPADASFISRLESGLGNKNPPSASNVVNVNSKVKDGMVNFSIKKSWDSKVTGRPLLAPTLPPVKDSYNICDIHETLKKCRIPRGTYKPQSSEKQKGIKVKQDQNSDPPVRRRDTVVKHEMLHEDCCPGKIAAAVSCVIPANNQQFLQLPSSLPSGCSSGRSSSGQQKVLLLRDPNKQLWPVLYHEVSGLNLLTSGWGAFMKVNNLRAGDKCIFMAKNINEGMCKVRIVRR